MPHVVALCGSLRDESRTKVLLESLLENRTEDRATTEPSISDRCELPSLHAVESEPPDADRLRATIDDAIASRQDAQLSRIVCRIAEGRPRLLSSRGVRRNDRPSACSRWPAASFRIGDRTSPTVSRTLHAWPLPTDVAVPNARTMITDEEIADEAVAERVRQLGRDLVAYADVALSRDGLPRDGDRNGVRGR